jgi:hypothetical protein
VEEQLGCFLTITHEGLARILVQTLDGARQVLQIAPDQAGIRNTDFQRLFAEGKLEGIETPIRLAESEGWNMEGVLHGDGGFSKRPR